MHGSDNNFIWILDISRMLHFMRAVLFLEISLQPNICPYWAILLITKKYSMKSIHLVMCNIQRSLFYLLVFFPTRYKPESLLYTFDSFLQRERKVRGRIACGHCPHRELGRDYLDHACIQPPFLHLLSLAHTPQFKVQCELRWAMVHAY